ncbi:hypothetical protein [Bdellovibrio sp. HCB2-146]|uniref:hypothetical protein n=1 Tax=Bdellovibrio sp. HCB2-146 TaxID=3394362 RepID=UPI0039BC9516
MRQILFIAFVLSVSNLALGAPSSVQIISKKQVRDLFVQKTGLELGDLVSAIKGETSARKKIQKFSLTQNPDAVLASFDKQIEKMKADCSKSSSSPTLCGEQAAEISKGVAALKGHSHKALAGDLTPKALQWHLAVVSHVVDEQVLVPLMKTWEVACDKSGKLNTPECKASFENIGRLQELMSDLLSWNVKYYASAHAPKISESTVVEVVKAYEK